MLKTNYCWNVKKEQLGQLTIIDWQTFFKFLSLHSCKLVPNIFLFIELMNLHIDQRQKNLPTIYSRNQSLKNWLDYADKIGCVLCKYYYYFCVNLLFIMWSWKASTYIICHCHYKVRKSPMIIWSIKLADSINSTVFIMWWSINFMTNIIFKTISRKCFCRFCTVR